MSRRRRRRSQPNAGGQGNGQQVAQKSSAILTGSAIFDFLQLGGSKSLAAQLTAAEQYWFYYDHHPWVGSVCDMIAGSIAADGYDIVAPGTDKDQGEVDSDTRVDALRLLFDSPNNDQSWDDLITEVSLDLDVTARCFLHILRVGANGPPVGFERIDSRTMAPKLNAASNKIAKFVQKISPDGFAWETKDYDPKDIIFFKRPGGKDLLGGTSLVERLDLTLAVDWSARKHNANYFRNGAKAGMVFINKKSTKDQADANQKTIELSRTGENNSYRPLFLSGEFDVHFPETKGDEEFTKGQDRALTDVCGVYHVPESKIKTTKGTLGGNGKEADDQTFHEECVMPRAKRIYRLLTKRILVDEFGITDLIIQPKAKYQFRLSAVDSAAKMLQGGGSINEARAVFGAPKSAAEGVDLDAPYVSTLVQQSQDKPDPLEMAKATAAVHYPPGKPGAPAPGEPGGKKASNGPKADAPRPAGRLRAFARTTGASNDSSSATTNS
jgi:hypothetical protein